MAISAEEAVAGKPIFRSDACRCHLHRACAVLSNPDKGRTGKEIRPGKRKGNGGPFAAHRYRREEYIVALDAHISLSLDVGAQSVIIKSGLNRKPGNPSFAIAFKPSDAVRSLLD